MHALLEQDPVSKVCAHVISKTCLVSTVNDSFWISDISMWDTSHNSGSTVDPELSPNSGSTVDPELAPNSGSNIGACWVRGVLVVVSLLVGVSVAGIF